MSTSILCIHVSTSGIVSDKFLPEPAMGNMRPDNPEYPKKYAEKLAKSREEALQDPALAVPDQITLYYLRVVPGDDTCALHTYGGETRTVLPWSQYAKIHDILESLPIGDDPVVLVGVHPTQHHRILVNSFIRKNCPVPAPLRWGRAWCFNPWRELGFTQEYPAPANLLGIPVGGDDETVATIDLVLRTGVPTCPI